MKIADYDVIVKDKDRVNVGCQEVTRGEIQAVLAEMDAWKAPTPTFGDFVEVVGGNRFVGEFGKVLFILTDLVFGNDSIAVEFPTYHSERHTLNGRTKKGHGWYFNPTELAIVP